MRVSGFGFGEMLRVWGSQYGYVGLRELLRALGQGGSWFDRDTPTEPTERQQATAKTYYRGLNN